jgi:MFS family permease
MRIHRAWYIALFTLGALVTTAAFRSSTGVLMEPIEHTFGWSRTTTSGAASLNLVLYGLTAPFAAAVMERFGIRRVVTVALLLVAVSSALTTIMTRPWQLWLLWGAGIGVGTGCMALVFGAIVANRWFHTHRGLVVGIFSAANAAGQLVFLPLIAATTQSRGWRDAALIVAVLALVMAVVVGLWFVDRPADRGFLPYGAGPNDVVVEPDRRRHPARVAITTLAESARSWPFWALVLTFWVCGWSTNGLIQTHFVPAAHDHGMPATTAAGLLSVVGIFDVIGTVCSGWLTDRVDPRKLLAVYYALRGVSLLTLQSVLAPHVEPSMWVFIIFYGLDWVATVPPTVALCRRHFGVARSGVVFGWVFASHMVGAGVGAQLAGAIRERTGAYHGAWIVAAGLCFAAAVTILTIRKVGEPAGSLTPAV